MLGTLRLADGTLCFVVALPATARKGVSFAPRLPQPMISLPIKRQRGRPKGVPVGRRRAIEAAILEALPIVAWKPGQPRPVRAFPRGWSRPNLRRVVSDAEKMLAALGAPVARRTIERALRNERPYVGPVPRDTRAADQDGRSSILIRHAADLLNADGEASRDALIEALYAWCIKRRAGGAPLPHSPFELALAYRASLTQKRATK